MKTAIICVIILFSSIFDKIFAQNFYAIDTIQNIEIQFSQTNWDYILDTAKLGTDSYTMATWVKINGIQFDSVGVKYKGNSSYNPNRVKNPFHIELDHFKTQNYMGYSDIKLSNGFKDPSFVREALSYKILRNYMDAPFSNFANVYVNGQFIGLYTNSEAITKTFAEKHFYSNTYPFFFMDNFGGDLRYNGPDSTLYFNTYTIKSNYGWNALVNLCNTLKNNINGIENFLDVDRSLWMLAFNNILVNLDSYIGQPKHNYYMYQDHNGRFNPIIWDVNEAFGNFQNAGTGQLSVTQEQNLSLMLHSNDSAWPLVKNLLSVPMFKRMYIAHAKTIVNEMFSNNLYYTDGQYLQGIIDSAVQLDLNKFYTYTDFLNNLTNNVTGGNPPFTAVGISNLMNTRTSFLNSTSEFQQQQPTISNINVSDTFPLTNSTIYITCNVSNANAVYCGIRGSLLEKFTRMQMLDDGLNGDGVAGDGIYGLTIVVSSTEIQYYFYAENSLTGVFLPQRAEHEWFTIKSNYNTLSYCNVVINELSAINSNIQPNGLGNYNDWIELYNNTSDTLKLDNLYISDDYANKLKWAIPKNTIILPNNYKIIWADADVVANELHCGFGLSGNGEQIILSYPNGIIIDSITFPPQITDITYGRYPNGNGSFGLMSPTFSATNSPIYVSEIKDDFDVKIFPNPASQNLNLIVSNNNLYNLKIEIYNIIGNKVISDVITLNNVNKTINVQNLNSGIYILKVFTENCMKNIKFIIK